MKILFACAVLLLAATLAAAQRRACTMSGDPHYMTFDGVYHDFMGFGAFQIIRSSSVNVQAQMRRCNFGAASVVTCIRSFSVKVTDPALEIASATIKWGSFDATPAWGNNSAQPTVIDPVIITETLADGTTTNLSMPIGDSRITASTGYNVLGGRYNVRSASGQLSVTQVGVTDGVLIQHSRYVLNVYMPLPILGRGATAQAPTGLCGLFDGNAANDFFTRTSTLAVSNTVAGRRYNGDAVNAWGNSYAVDGVNIQPLMRHFHHQLTGMVTMDIPEAGAPSSTEQQQLEKVNFQNIDEVQAAERQCREINTNGDQIAFQNCMYDIAALNAADPINAFSFAQSNQAASTLVTETLNTDDGSSGGLSAGAKGAIAAGVIAGVAFVVAGVLYVRLRHTRQELSKALVLAQGGSSSSGRTDASAIRLQDNL